MRVSTGPSSQKDAAPAAPRITVTGACKSYGSLQVFRDVNLRVGHREILALVGPSGCGKTTLLRCLDGLIPMTEGEVRVDGQRVTGPLPKAAMVFQHFGLFPWKTVFGNVAYGLRLAGASKAGIQERGPDFIQLGGLGGVGEAFPFQLSGGGRTRWGLGAALGGGAGARPRDGPFARLP